MAVDRLNATELVLGAGSSSIYQGVHRITRMDGKLYWVAPAGTPNASDQAVVMCFDGHFVTQVAAGHTLFPAVSAIEFTGIAGRGGLLYVSINATHPTFGPVTAIFSLHPDGTIGPHRASSTGVEFVNELTLTGPGQIDSNQFFYDIALHPTEDVLHAVWFDTRVTPNVWAIVAFAISDAGLAYMPDEAGAWPELAVVTSVYPSLDRHGLNGIAVTDSGDVWVVGWRSATQRAAWHFTSSISGGVRVGSQVERIDIAASAGLYLAGVAAKGEDVFIYPAVA